MALANGVTAPGGASAIRMLSMNASTRALSFLLGLRQLWEKLPSDLNSRLARVGDLEFVRRAVRSGFGVH